MKAISTLTLIAVAAAFIAPNSLHAGDKERALIGGLIGGIVIGTIIADDNFDTHVDVGYHHSGHHSHHASPGYWKSVSVKRWVPGYYERSCDRYGRTRKVWISGHYDWAEERVWVTTYRSSSRGHYDYGHSGRYSQHGSRDKSRYERRGRSTQVIRRF